MGRVRDQRYQQLDALRGAAAMMVVINHFILLGPLWWMMKSPVRLLALGHEAVILFFMLSGFVLTLQLTSGRPLAYRDYLIRRVCRIYVPYMVVLLATFTVVNSIVVRPFPWAGAWFNSVWVGQFSGAEIRDHFLFVGQYNASHVIPVVWSLVYEMRISLMMPLVVYAVVRASARMCVVVALIVSAVSLALVVGQGANPKNANFSGDWAMTAHYLGIFIAGATLAVHRARWRRWLSRDGRAEKVLAASLALYFLSRFVMSVAHGAIGQFIFDWCVAAGAAGLICAALVSKRFASVLAMRPVMFLGALSYSLYLTHTVTLLAVIHLVPLSGSAWPAIIAAALLVVPVAALVHFAVERPSIVLGQFLTGRSVADSQQAKQTS